VPPEGWLRDFPPGAVKYVTPPDGVDAASLLARFESADTDALLGMSTGAALRSPPIRPDPGDQGGPCPRALQDRRAAGGPRVLAAQRRRGHRLLPLRPRRDPLPGPGHREPAWRLAGLAGRDQLGWLDAELGDCAARPVLLFSHHPLETLVNDRRPPARTAGSWPPSCARCCLATRA